MWKFAWIFVSHVSHVSHVSVDTPCVVPRQEDDAKISKKRKAAKKQLERLLGLPKRKGQGRSLLFNF